MRTDGGTAFPVSIPGCGDNGQEGMSLRDYFAAQALSTGYVNETTSDPDKIAEWAYQVADAMLAARSNNR